MEDPRAEAEPLPGDWKRIHPFDRLLVIRCIRPDRMNEAMGMLVGDVMGAKYTVSQSFNLEKSFEDSRPDVPIFFFLSPGVDVMSSVDASPANYNNQPQVLRTSTAKRADKTCLNAGPSRPCRRS